MFLFMYYIQLIKQTRLSYLSQFRRNPFEIKFFMDARANYIFTGERTRCKNFTMTTVLVRTQTKSDKEKGRDKIILFIK